MQENINADIQKQLNNCQELLQITNKLRVSLMNADANEIELLINKKEKLLINIKNIDKRIQIFRINQGNLFDQHKNKIQEIKNLVNICRSINKSNINFIANNIKSLNRLKKTLMQAKNNLCLVYNKQGQVEIIGEPDGSTGVNV